MEFVAACIVCLGAFLFTMATTLRPVKVIGGFRLSMSTAPVVSTVVLLVAGIITPVDVVSAVQGDGDALKPYTIIVTFLSLAYICVVMESSGVGEALAIAIIHKAATSYRRLLMYVFALSATMTMFTSSDLVVLTTTPIICSLSQMASIDAKPLLFVQFFTANVFSVILSISDSANLMVAEDAGFDFVAYFNWMVLPTAAAGLGLIVSFWFLFGQHVKDHAELAIQCQTPAPAARTALDREFALSADDAGAGPESVRWQDAVKDPPRARAAVSAYACALLSLVLSSFFPMGLDISQICMIFALTLFVADVALEAVPFWRQYGRLEVIKARDHVLALPWKLVPFTVGMFVLSKALAVIEFNSVVAWHLGLITGHDVFSAAIAMVFIAMICCNLMTELPMTIFFLSVMGQRSFTDAIVAAGGARDIVKIRRAMLLAVSMGANFGANLCVTGATAGLLWRNILRTRYNISISHSEFLRKGVSCMVPVVFLSVLVLSTEIQLS
ncbi:Citrate transporter-like domain-containing protein [Plasmodiophora brassicae]